MHVSYRLRSVKNMMGQPEFRELYGLALCVYTVYVCFPTLPNRI